jgi:hypothetical protein
VPPVPWAVPACGWRWAERKGARPSHQIFVRRGGGWDDDPRSNNARSEHARERLNPCSNVTARGLGTAGNERVSQTSPPNMHDESSSLWSVKETGWEGFPHRIVLKNDEVPVLFQKLRGLCVSWCGLVIQRAPANHRLGHLASYRPSERRRVRCGRADCVGEWHQTLAMMVQIEG